MKTYNKIRVTLTFKSYAKLFFIIVIGYLFINEIFVLGNVALKIVSEKSIDNPESLSPLLMGAFILAPARAFIQSMAVGILGYPFYYYLCRYKRGISMEVVNDLNK